MACANYFLNKNKPQLDLKKLHILIQAALKEDIGRADITTSWLIPGNKKTSAKIIARENFLLCGISIAEKVFKTVDQNLRFEKKIKEGQKVRAGATIAVISGRAASILTAERVALNFLALLSGVATKTRDFVLASRPFKTKITDTRKTLAGLRDLQKYAVRIGGGYNHRMCLEEMILVKDNHLKINRNFNLASLPKGKKIEIEAQNLQEFKHALQINPDVIMLDNMQIKEIRTAVKIRNNFTKNKKLRPPLLEASGGVSLANLKKYAASGVDLISVGELTDSINNVDISLEII